MTELKNDQNLISKYQTAAPRYTSYPPVPFWKKKFTQEEWVEQVGLHYDNASGIDIYIHVPFCESLCYYCGCNRVITKDKEKGGHYVDTLLKEWQIYSKHIGQSESLVVHSVHLGGGTPTFLPPQELDRLLAQLLKKRSSGFIGSVEIDPRTCREEHLEVLLQHDIKRVSLGIQDFNREVQQAIHRLQDFELVKNLCHKIRQRAFASLNFDLIYGLPKQDIKSIEETIQKVMILAPDTIAFYSYAHLPEKIKNQKLINCSELPNGEQKRQLYERGKELLLSANYVEVGMDHFARPGSFLHKAKEENKLVRNFMGYLDSKSNILLGLGASAISSTPNAYMQNAKDLSTYLDAVAQDQLAIHIGHILDAKDQVANQIIQKLMCQNIISKLDLKNYDGPSAPNQEWQKGLEQFLADGILIEDSSGFKLSDKGAPFMRNVAVLFDHHLKAQKNPQEKAPQFSQTI